MRFSRSEGRGAAKAERVNAKSARRRRVMCCIMTGCVEGRFLVDEVEHFAGRQVSMVRARERLRCPSLKLSMSGVRGAFILFGGGALK